MKQSVFLTDLGMVNALGSNRAAIMAAVMLGSRAGIRAVRHDSGTFSLGAMDLAPALPDEVSLNRVQRLLKMACDQIKTTVDSLKGQYGANRIAVIIGSTDNGSEASRLALLEQRATGHFPAGYQLLQQTAHYPAQYVAAYLGLESLAFAVSTACASSATAMVIARNLIRANFCDAVVVGGADIVSPAVLLGFNALEAVDPAPCQPFSANRRGINLGEGAALFVMDKQAVGDNPVLFMGAGESIDAHHMTAPDPEGKGAILAMQAALADGGIAPELVDYLNLHGTATTLNDSMEATATATVFAKGLPCSSTKSLIGHTLGAAGAMEAGICWAVFLPANSQKQLPPHIWDGVRDHDLPAIDLVNAKQTSQRLKICMSNSYAFGGCNVSLLLGAPGYD